MLDSSSSKASLTSWRMTISSGVSSPDLWGVGSFNVHAYIYTLFCPIHENSWQVYQNSKGVCQHGNPLSSDAHQCHVVLSSLSINSSPWSICPISMLVRYGQMKGYLTDPYFSLTQMLNFSWQERKSFLKKFWFLNILFCRRSALASCRAWSSCLLLSWWSPSSES